MSKRVGAEIILDEASRDAIKASPDSKFRLRRLAKVRPAGFKSSLEISELVPEVEDSFEAITDPLIEEYEAALERFYQGDHQSALEKLRSLPDWDGPTRFLIDQITNGDHSEGIINLPK